MINYSLNWMGPLSLDWYKTRGLAVQVPIVVEPDSWYTHSGYQAGDTVTQTEVTARYCCGRVDVSGVPDEPYGTEIGVPPMLAGDWHDFAMWLEKLSTDYVYTLTELVTEYEQTHEPITWYTPLEE
jgi:hypothetical protein